jgi:hypothetical protein
LPFLLLVTWNESEGGTAIERGTGNCAARQQNQATADASNWQAGSSNIRY